MYYLPSPPENSPQYILKPIKGKKGTAGILCKYKYIKYSKFLVTSTKISACFEMNIQNYNGKVSSNSKTFVQQGNIKTNMYF